MNADYAVKTIPRVRLVAQTRTMRPDEIGQHVEAMFDAVARALGDVPGGLDLPMATYLEVADGLEVIVGYASQGPAPTGCTVVELPEARAVCGVHIGEMSGIGDSWGALHEWIGAEGYTYAGPCREVYVRASSPDQSDWVTELQQPIGPH